MTRFHRLGRSRRLHVAVALFATTVLVAACEPGFVTTFAGTGNNSGTLPSATVSPVSSSARLQQPTSVVAVRGVGFYVYDATACAVYRVNNNGTTSLYAGTPGTCGDAGDGGPATNAQIDGLSAILAANIYEMAIDGAGNLYFTSDNGQALRKVDHTTGIISSITVPQPPGGTGYRVSGLATDTDGSIAIQATNLSSTYLYRLGGDSTFPAFTTTYIFGSGDSGFGLANTGPGRFATWIVNGSTVDVYRVDVTAGTIADTGVAASGMGSSVLAGTSDGTIYLGNPGNAANTIVRIDPDNMVTHLAGSGMADPGTGKQGGTGTQSMITPAGLTLTRTGLLFSSGHAVYRLNAPAQVGVTTTMPGMPGTTTSTMPGMPGTTTSTMPGMPGTTTSTMPGMPDNISIPTNSPAGAIIWPMPMADMMMDPGMEMVTPNCTAMPTADQQAAALTLVNTTVADVAPYKSLSYAKAHGYFAVTPVGLPIVHYMNLSYLSTTLNPAKIGSLVYANTTHGAVLVAAMYMLPLNDTGVSGPQPGGCLNEWHIHTNLCYSTTTLLVVNVTNSEGKCPAGSENHVTSAMMHVWLAPVSGGPLVMDASDQKAVAAAETLPLLDPLNGTA